MMLETVSRSCPPFPKSLSIKLKKTRQVEWKLFQHLSNLGKCWTCLGDKTDNLSSKRNSNRILIKEGGNDDKIIGNIMGKMAIFSYFPKKKNCDLIADLNNNCCNECIQVLQILLDLETDLERIEVRIKRNLTVLRERRKARIEEQSDANCDVENNEDGTDWGGDGDYVVDDQGSYDDDKRDDDDIIHYEVTTEIKNEPVSDTEEFGTEIEPDFDADVNYSPEDLSDLSDPDDDDKKTRPTPRKRSHRKKSTTSHGLSKKEYMALTFPKIQDLNNIVCPECPNSMRYTRIDSWRIHYKRHHLGFAKPHKCSHCQKSYSTRHILHRHVASKHPSSDPSIPAKKTYPCPKCGRRLGSKFAWAGHQLTVCEVPLDLSTLSFKIEVTSCPVEGCKSKFYGKKGLEKHAICHTGEKPFVCGLCGDRFTRIGSLRSHEDYACEKGKKLERKKKNRNRTRVNSIFAQFACSLCPRKFQMRYALSKHMQTCRKRKNKIKITKKMKVVGIRKDKPKPKKELPEQKEHDIKVVDEDPDFDYCPDNEEPSSSDEGDGDIKTDPDFSNQKNKKKKKRATRNTTTDRPRNYLSLSYPTVDPKNIVCPDCPNSIKYTRIASFKSHYKRRHLGFAKHYKCPHCEKAFASSYALRNHSISQHRSQDSSLPPKKTYPCPKCGKHLSSKVAWAGHQITVCDVPLDLSTLPFKISILPCPIEGCDIQFYNKIGLDKHIFSHSGQKPFKCDKCGMTFTRQDNLQGHHDYACESGKKLARVKKPRKKGEDRTPATSCAEFPCTKCPRMFKRKFTLQQHLKTCTGETGPLEKPKGICDICGKSMLLAEVPIHKRRIHEGVKKYVCKFCGKRFFHPNSLKVHTIGVHEQKGMPKERNHLCHVCGKGFTGSGSLWEHKNRVHLKMSKFACSLCGMKFMHKNDLRKHFRGHENRGEAAMEFEEFLKISTLPEKISDNNLERF